MKLITRPLRELRAANSSHGVSAASGLVKVKNDFYVIADDQLSLARFNFEGPTDLQFTPLVVGDLPGGFQERKKVKPDWESLCEISHQDFSGLLAVPSGSAENRCLGIFVPFQFGKISSSQVTTIEFAQIFAELRLQIPELNIEGAVVFEENLKLFQRGNGAEGFNAVIDIELEGFIEDVKSGQPISSRRIKQILQVDLGTVKGVGLGFTDACVVDRSIWFLAAAENIKSTYDDGLFCGAIFGCLNSNGVVERRYDLDCLAKPEGLWVESAEKSLAVYYVTDADSPQIYSSIYFGRLLL